MLLTVASGDLRVPGGPVIPAAELRWRYSASGGPGGQHANTTNTRVELLFDPTTSAVLDEQERRLIVARLGSPVRVVAAGERSQWRNRQAALHTLADRLAGALEVRPKRRPTTIGQSTTERRREERRRAQARRQARRWRYEQGE